MVVYDSWKGKGLHLSLINATHLYPSAKPQARGYEPESRPVVDLAKYWTMVDKTPFTVRGTVDRIEVYSGKSGRRFRVGIYSPNGGCSFTLKQQVEFASLPTGMNSVSKLHNIIIYLPLI